MRIGRRIAVVFFVGACGPNQDTQALAPVGSWRSVDGPVGSSVPWAPLVSLNAFWTGEQALVVGGGGAALFQPTTNDWNGVDFQAYRSTMQQAVALADNSVVVWGGMDLANNNTEVSKGAVLSLSTKTWKPMSDVGAPSPRQRAQAVWSGSTVIVWGGLRVSGGGVTVLTDGGRYNPIADVWSPIGSTGAPTPRLHFSLVWTGKEMIVWGGSTFEGLPLQDGGAYDPTTDSWRTLSSVGAPRGRGSHTAIWTGTRMIVWGGLTSGNAPSRDGAEYDPETNSWGSVALQGAPSERLNHTAVWTGTEMIVWGGATNGHELADGGIYNPTTHVWVASTAVDGAPSPRAGHAAVWLGTEMFVWGGSQAVGDLLQTGGRYRPE